MNVHSPYCPRRRAAEAFLHPDERIWSCSHWKKSRNRGISAHRRGKERIPFTPRTHAPPAFQVASAHLSCTAPGMGSSVWPRFHCQTGSNSMEMCAPVVPSTALHLPRQTSSVSLCMKSSGSPACWAPLLQPESQPSALPLQHDFKALILATLLRICSKW